MSNTRQRAVQIYRASSWPESAPSIAEIERAGIGLHRAINAQLSGRSPRTLDRVILNANRRVSISLEEPRRASAQLRLHWLLLPDPRLASAVAGAVEHGRFSPVLRTILDDVGERVRTGDVYPSSSRYNPQGEWIHLGRVLDRVRTMLPEPVSADAVGIGWGQRGAARGKKRQRTIRLGSMVERDGMIRVHPVLDDPWVPREVLEYVVYHELCHFVEPPLTTREARALGEHRVHHRRFRALERRYPALDSARRWIDANLNELLRRASRGRR